ncbi:MAG: DUF1501 domain-containing protein [Alphaproteobacteria bacterium]|nr:DUF1501 domain-containing protein [Alphaproteobacteria bacterium]
MHKLRPLTRRSLMVAGCAASLVSAGPAFARAGAGDPRLVVVILRGAMDGLAALPKLDDPHIEAHRAGLIDRAAQPLDGGFALHSAFTNLAALYRSGEAAFIPAVAGPYRERSHFAAQDLLECGRADRVVADGWLNRALQRAPAGVSALSIGPVQPLILRGGGASITSWSPPVLPEASEDTIGRLLELYDSDPILAPSLTAALSAEGVLANGSGAMAPARGRGGDEYRQLLSAAGKFLAEPNGPRIAVVSLDGWDTHAGQSAMLNQRFGALDRGIAGLAETLGPAWKQTAVIAVSEFGRTVRENGARGTDHGTAGLAILAGGAIRGGRVAGEWPGLAPSALYENRDLAGANDVRSLFKGLLRNHLGWDAIDLDNFVFPSSAAAPAEATLV